MMDKGRAYSDKAGRSVEKGVDVVQSAYGGVDLLPDERITAANILKGMTFLAGALSQVARETAHNTAAIAAMNEQVTTVRRATDEEVAAMKRLLNEQDERSEQVRRRLEAIESKLE